MSEWWEQANPGGPMVGPAFTRPLYPPDANKKGKKPSTEGDDVSAIKRAVSRAGRWPWQAFDDAYSNAFAHGKSGNVSETGMAGLQRQNGIDPTGWMGERSYNLIRSARIPDGLPHAGEPILDGVAVALLEQFRKDWTDGGKTLRAAALALAKDQLGYVESPPGTNGNMYGSWYGMNYEPWCAIFCTYCFEHAEDGGSPSFVKGSRYAYVPYVVADARNGRYGLSVTSSPIAGDLVCYDWNWNGEYDHIGIFDSGSPGGFYAIEGNTSLDNNSNGGEVMRRWRTVTGQGTVFVRVDEP